MREVEIAAGIAERAHAGQIEKSTGDPYILHVKRVVDMVLECGERCAAIAWLHDVLEDTPLVSGSLQLCGISERVIQAVVLLTKMPSETYEQYIQRIQDSGDILAQVVKIADLRDHFRPNCPPRLLPRYRKAWTVLAGTEPPM